MGWIILRELPKRTIEVSISDVPFPNRNVERDELGLFNPSLFGEVQWLYEIGEWKKGELFKQILPSEDADDYLSGMDMGTFDSRGSAQYELVELIEAQLRTDGLPSTFFDPSEPVSHEKRPSARIAGKISDLKVIRRTLIKNGHLKRRNKTEVIADIPISRKTVEKWAPKLWEDWYVEEYID
jgi:hypothetical protein